MKDAQKATALEMNDVFLKAISSIRQAKEDQERLREQQRAMEVRRRNRMHEARYPALPVSIAKALICVVVIMVFFSSIAFAQTELIAKAASINNLYRF